MSLVFEIFSVEDGGWKTAAVLKPGDRPASLADNKSGGGRDVYVFECDPDDRSSRILKSESGVDAANNVQRILLTTNFQVVRVLTDGEQYEMSIGVAGKPVPVQARFSHRIEH